MCVWAAFAIHRNENVRRIDTNQFNAIIMVVFCASESNFNETWLKITCTLKISKWISMGLCAFQRISWVSELLAIRDGMCVWCNSNRKHGIAPTPILLLLTRSLASARFGSASALHSSGYNRLKALISECVAIEKHGKPPWLQRNMFILAPQRSSLCVWKLFFSCCNKKNTSRSRHKCFVFDFF